MTINPILRRCDRVTRFARNDFSWPPVVLAALGSARPQRARLVCTPAIGAVAAGDNRGRTTGNDSLVVLPAQLRHGRAGD